MGHTNQTANYNLPQFVGTDKPSWLGDINDAFAAIDTAIAAAASEASTADGKADALGTTVSGHTTQIGVLNNTVTTQGNTLNTVTSLIGNGTPTTTDQTIIGAINELHADQGDLEDLQTTDKSSLVAAINEAAQSGGGGSQSVRYYNGYIQYSTDGGTTWINLINVSTPVQLLPLMDSNVNAFGIASCTSSAYSATAYGAIDGSGGQVFVSAQEELKFEFTNAQFVNDFKITYWNAGTYSHTARCEYTEDGITWMAGDSVTVAANDSTEREYSYHIGKTVKAIRFVNSDVSGGGNFGLKKMEAYN